MFSDPNADDLLLKVVESIVEGKAYLIVFFILIIN